MAQDWKGLAGELQELLSLDMAPIAITFLEAVPAGYQCTKAPCQRPRLMDGRESLGGVRVLGESGRSDVCDPLCRSWQLQCG